MSSTSVLIVEDEVIIAHGLSRILKKLGYQVVDMVMSGEDAIDAAKKYQPDIILMDLILQGEVSGIQAAAAIINANNIPVIYVTAYTDENTLREIRQVGGYGFLVKPYKKEQLHAAIQLALGQHQHIVNNHHAESKDKSELVLNRENILSFGHQLFSCAHPVLSVISILVIRCSIHQNSDDIAPQKREWEGGFIKMLSPVIKKQDVMGQLTENEFLLLSHMRTLSDSKQWTQDIIQRLHIEGCPDSKPQMIFQVGVAYSSSEDKTFDRVFSSAYQSMEVAPLSTAL